MGSALGNLVHHCRGSRHSLRSVLSTMRRTLDPAADALCSCDGSDVPLLVKGMACFRVVSPQGRFLRAMELNGAPPIDSRSGHVGVAVGACASLLTAFCCISSTPFDCEGLSAQLTTSLRETQSALINWRVSDCADAAAFPARLAEARAIERARAAVARARERASRPGVIMTAKAEMDLQLLFFRRAAWPRGQEISADTQDLLLQKIASGELTDFAHPSEHAEVQLTPGVVALSAIASLEGLTTQAGRDGGDGGDGRDNDASSSSRSGSSYSSWGNSSSDSSSSHASAERAAAAMNAINGFTTQCSFFSPDVLSESARTINSSSNGALSTLHIGVGML